MQHIIEVHGLHKHFGHVHALDELALTVDAGEIHGFLGPNGSGKSTTIRVLLGILRATAGQARMLGRDPWSEAVALHREVAYVPGDVTLWASLSGGETTDLLARLRDTPMSSPPTGGRSSALPTPPTVPRSRMGPWCFSSARSSR